MPQTPPGLSAPGPGPAQALDAGSMNCAMRSSSNRRRQDRRRSCPPRRQRCRFSRQRARRLLETHHHGLATGPLEELRIAQFFPHRSRPCLVRVEGRRAPAGPGAEPRRDAHEASHAQPSGGEGGRCPSSGSTRGVVPRRCVFVGATDACARRPPRGTRPASLTLAWTLLVVPRDKAHRERTRDVWQLDKDPRPLRTRVFRLDLPPGNTLHHVSGGKTRPLSR